MDDLSLKVLSAVTTELQRWDRYKKPADETLRSIAELLGVPVSLPPNSSRAQADSFTPALRYGSAVPISSDTYMDAKAIDTQRAAKSTERAAQDSPSPSDKTAACAVGQHRLCIDGIPRECGCLCHGPALHPSKPTTAFFTTQTGPTCPECGSLMIPDGDGLRCVNCGITQPEPTEEPR